MIDGYRGAVCAESDWLEFRVRDRFFELFDLQLAQLQLLVFLLQLEFQHSDLRFKRIHLLLELQRGDFLLFRNLRLLLVQFFNLEVQTEHSVFIVLLFALNRLLTRPGAEPFGFLVGNRRLDLLLLGFKSEDFSVLLLDVTHDLPL